MRLLPAPQLQAMLQAAQKFVSLRQFMEILATDVALIVQLLQREQRAAGAQPFFLAAIHSLQALHQELNIADSAAIHLYINATIATPRRLLLASSRADATLRDQRRLDSSKVQTAAINAVLHAVNKLARDVDIAGSVPRLDERLQLPIVGVVFVVEQRVRQRYGGLAFLSLGTQAQVDAKNGAFARR